MRRIIVLVVSATALAAPASAQAHFLSKKQAKNKTANLARELCNRLDWCTSWSVVPSQECERYSDHVVECAFDVYDDDGGTACDNRALISFRYAWGRTLTFSFPGEPDCHDA